MGARNAGVLWARPVAYLCRIRPTRIVRLFGGLGILAGDHIKAASDLGIPLVGVGLYYDQGYFTQRFDLNGCQQEDYRDVDSSLLPLEPARDANGQPVAVAIETRTGAIAARVWKLAVGRNTLLLLDSDVDGNEPEDRALTSRLYGGDDRVRIRQDCCSASAASGADALGISPGVVISRGHSAFAALELARNAWRAKASAPPKPCAASSQVSSPPRRLPAGHDRFAPPLVEEHLGPLRSARDERRWLLALGARIRPIRSKVSA